MEIKKKKTSLPNKMADCDRLCVVSMWHSEKEELGYERICFILKTEKKRKGSDGKDYSCRDTRGFQPKELDPYSSSYVDRAEKRNFIQSGS